jgi:hypothetical protein
MPQTVYETLAPSIVTSLDVHQMVVRKLKTGTKAGFAIGSLKIRPVSSLG